MSDIDDELRRLWKKDPAWFAGKSMSEAYFGAARDLDVLLAIDTADLKKLSEKSRAQWSMGVLYNAALVGLLSRHGARWNSSEHSLELAELLARWATLFDDH